MRLENLIIIMEDDRSLDLIRFWNFTWKDFYSRIIYDWDVIKLHHLLRRHSHQNHKRFVNEFSTACYLITRHHAEKMIRNFHCRGDKYKLDNGVRPRPVG